MGGTSIGAFVAAVWAKYRDVEEMDALIRQSFDGMSGRNFVSDLTYPVVSITTGAAGNDRVRCLGEMDIEDLWIPYYCVSTDVTVSRERVHTSGQLWPYVRASMSCAWFFPPICDPVDGHMLLDGCYVNNVPGKNLI